jgi:hypothetical protein
MHKRRTRRLEQPSAESEREEHVLEIAFVHPFRVIEEEALDDHGTSLQLQSRTE